MIHDKKIFAFVAIEARSEAGKRIGLIPSHAATSLSFRRDLKAIAGSLLGNNQDYLRHAGQFTDLQFAASRARVLLTVCLLILD